MEETAKRTDLIDSAFNQVFVRFGGSFGGRENALLDLQ